MTDLKELLARVEAATGPDREIDRDLIELLIGGEYTEGNRWGDGWMLLGSCRMTPPGKLTASIDAALALAERVAGPGLMDVGFSYDLGQPEGWPAATVRWYPAGTAPDGRRWHAQVGSARTVPLAILAALLKAKIAGA